MAQKQKVELNFSDVDDFHFKAPLSERERKKVNIIKSICDIL